MNFYEKVLNIITIGGYQLYKMDKYIKERDKYLDERREAINELIREQKELSKTFDLVKEKLRKT